MGADGSRGKSNFSSSSSNSRRGLATRKALFGGEIPWNASDWTASDDRVRGGKSQSYLTLSDGAARFHGNLDIQTLGGAGFASQRTTGEDREWDLSEYHGIEIMTTTSIEDNDDKQYTFILKDELLPRDPNTGREQSTISYEYDFKLSTAEFRQSAGGNKSGATTTTLAIFIPWKELKPTYRGKEKKDAAPIKLQSIKRISLMMRSFFGTQQGAFSLTLLSISAAAVSTLAPVSAATIVEAASTPQQVASYGARRGASSQDSELAELKPDQRDAASSNQGFFLWLWGRCWKL